MNYCQTNIIKIVTLIIITIIKRGLKFFENKAEAAKGDLAHVVWLKSNALWSTSCQFEKKNIYF